MFDVKAKDHSICVRALHLTSGSGGGAWPYCVYTAAGSWKSIASKKSKWTQVGKEIAALPRPCQGLSARVKLVEDGVHIAAGCVQSFYVHSPSHMTAITFTAKPLDQETKLTLRDSCIMDEDAYLSILTGAKTCSEVAFASVSTDQVRAFAGSIEYVLWCES